MKTDLQNIPNQSKPSLPLPNHPHLDDALLEKFMRSFYGYGNYSASIWFIGMEEGGGGRFREVRRRLETWESRGEQELEDVRAYHEALELDRFFKEPVKLQRTWARLIRIYLSANGLETDREAVRAFQKETLGQRGSDTCLVDLSHLKSRIAEHRPRWVVFYGTSYREHWVEIAGKPLTKIQPHGFEFCRGEATGYLAVRHPAARGVNDEYFMAAGRWIGGENQ